MYTQRSTWRPIALLAALVASATLATSSVNVAAGETLSEIALRNDVSVAQLVAWNDLEDPDRILAGSTLVTTGAPAPDGSVDGSHLVTAGETLSAIAVRFATTVGRLASSNEITDPDRIYAGQRLRLAGDVTTVAAGPDAAGSSHTVAAGETLSEIAELHGVRTGVLARDNGISDPDRIVVGMTLDIGAPAPAARPAPAEDVADSTTSPTGADTPTTTVPTTTVPTTTSPTTTAPTTTAPEPTASDDGSSATPGRDGEVLLVPLFERWSRVYDVPRGLLEAIAWHESDWRPRTVGADGSLGITQLSPDTVAFIESSLLGREVDPLDASDGIQIGARYLRYLLDRTSDEQTATAAWAQGLEAVARDGVTDAGASYLERIEEIRRLRS